MTVSLALGAPTRADPYEADVKVSAGPLAHTLLEIARQTDGELLFDHALIDGRQAPRIDMHATRLKVVHAALAGTGLHVRQAASGVLLIEAPAPAPLARQDAPVPEILVIGHRSQNADIRRNETDIQPYHVITADQITGAGVADIGEYFDSHVTSDAAVPVSAAGGLGETNSRIDLRGLGPDETLVLIDGRRMPSFPHTGYTFTQPDLNPIPVHDIERIEVLTGTAGGIYGFGALGGVINVVLAHDRPGVELYATAAESSRGDAGQASLEARVEFSPDRGATEVTVDASASGFQPLTAGQRDYLAKDRQASYQNDPSDVLQTAPNGNTIAAFNLIPNQPLALKPAYGGAALGAPFTLLPTGFEESPQALEAALIHSAGELNLGLSRGEAATDLVATPELGSVLMNVRHQFSSGFEAYFDGVMLWNHGRYIDHTSNGEVFLSPSSPYDPFEQDVAVSFPLAPSTQISTTRFDSSRFTVGGVAPIAFEWRATAEATWGGAQFEQTSSQSTVDPSAAYNANPFGGWALFQQALLNAPLSGYSKIQVENIYREQSLKLAGPLFSMPGGPAILTLLAERRGEDVPAYSTVGAGTLATTAGLSTAPVAQGTNSVASQSTTTTSVYAELRSRVFSDKAPSPLLREFEVQLAARGDSQANDFSADPTLPGSPRLHAVFTGASYTVGAKASPLQGLTLRGSFATGQTPPPTQDLLQYAGVAATQDPQRGGLAYFPATAGGASGLKNVLATTASVGFVLTPFGPRGLQFSLDYSRIRKSHDILFLNPDLILAHEGYWPQRVQRAPLTAADQALGYTAGPITMVDATAINGASLDVQTIDARFDWPIALQMGAAHVYGTATNNVSDVQKALFSPEVKLQGYFNTPLRWRANLGADWLIGPLILGGDLQYFDSYNIADSGSPANFSDLIYMFQGAKYTPAQAYLDLRISRRFHLSNTDFRLDFSIKDVLDTPPPRETSAVNLGAGYSQYGDPRRRRFQLSTSAVF